MYGIYLRLNVRADASHRTLLRALRKKMRKEFLHDRAFREERHSVYRQMLQFHAEAGELYRMVA